MTTTTLTEIQKVQQEIKWAKFAIDNAPSKYKNTAIIIFRMNAYNALRAKELAMLEELATQHHLKKILINNEISFEIINNQFFI